MKITTLTAALLLAGGFSTTASAHIYTGTLGSSATATDKFYFVCDSRTAKLSYRIKRNVSGSPNVSAKSIQPNGAVAVSSNTSYGPFINVATSGGAKVFEIKKSPAVATGVAMSYSLNAHCFDANGIKNPDSQTSPQIYIQNQ